MTGSVVLRSSATHRGETLLKNSESPAAPRHRRKKIGEVAGGSAAECAAVCCCCPCVLMDLVVLTVYRLPAGLWRKKKLRRQLRKRKDALLQRPSSEPASPEVPVLSGVDGGFESAGELEADMDKEMWAQFYGTGFWRSPSQRGT